MGGFLNAVTGGQSTITSANSVVSITVPGLYSAPVLLFGYAADRAWEAPNIAVTETVIGVDGRKTAGIIFNPVKQTFSFQADSPSVQLFESIYAAQLAARDIYYINGTIILPATGEAYICNQGTLEDYNPIAGAGRVLQTRTFAISWRNIQPSLA